jgi:hypothetical protein
LWTLTHHTDLARGLMPLLANPRAIGEAFHITSDDVLTRDQITHSLAAAAGVQAQIVHVPSEAIAAADHEWGAGLLGDKAHSWDLPNGEDGNHGGDPGQARPAAAISARPPGPGKPGGRGMAECRPPELGGVLGADAPPRPQQWAPGACREGTTLRRVIAGQRPGPGQPDERNAPAIAVSF